MMLEHEVYFASLRSLAVEFASNTTNPRAATSEIIERVDLCRSASDSLVEFLDGPVDRISLNRRMDFMDVISILSDHPSYMAVYDEFCQLLLCIEDYDGDDYELIQAASTAYKFVAGKVILKVLDMGFIQE